MKTIWILTKEYNDYDQYGEYFVAAWFEKPTWHQLRDTLKSERENDQPVKGNLVTHILNGGGRRYPENQWFNLQEFEEGTTKPTAPTPSQPASSPYPQDPTTTE